MAIWANGHIMHQPPLEYKRDIMDGFLLTRKTPGYNGLYGATIEIQKGRHHENNLFGGSTQLVELQNIKIRNCEIVNN